MGGWVVLKFALEYPERVRRFFVANSPGINFEVPFDPTLFQPTTVERAHQFLVLLTPRAALLPRFVARDVLRRMRPIKWVVQRATKSMIARADLLDGKLRAIRAPALIIWGKQDALVPVACAEEMHRQMPHSVLAVFDGAGHLAPAECSRRVTPEILRFLAAEPPLPPSAREFPK